MKSSKPAKSAPEAEETATCAAARRGRPRGFDVDQALDAAMRVFWQHGYEGTSLPELEAAMGINRPSLYAAFGNKEALFRKAIDRYVERTEEAMRAALDAPTAREAIARLFKLGAAGCERSETRGCMLVQSLSCSEASASVQRELAERRAKVEVLLRERLAKGVADGDLPADANVDAIAKYLATFQQGMAVQAASGATREQMLAAVEVALRALPG